jgi:predicted nucleic acid-binding protein
VFYLDTSVLLAEIFSETIRPPLSIFAEALVASRLLEVEVWCSIRRRNIAESHGAYAQDLLDRVDLIDLTPTILQRACQPMAAQLRTLDAIHVATILEINEHQTCKLLSFDREMIQSAGRLGIEVV